MYIYIIYICSLSCYVYVLIGASAINPAYMLCISSLSSRYSYRYLCSVIYRCIYYPIYHAYLCSIYRCLSILSILCVVYLYAYLSYICSLIYIRYVYGIGIGFLCGPSCAVACIKGILIVFLQ